MARLHRRGTKPRFRNPRDPYAVRFSRLVGKEGSINGEDLLDLHKRTREATHTLQANATEILEQAKRLELLTKDTPAWYAATRARVEARATLEQAEELRRVLKELGERLGE